MDFHMVETMEKVEQNHTEVLLNEFTTESGIKFRINKIKMSYVRDAWKQLKVPQVPKVFIEEKERWEDNPNDPTYREELNVYQSQRTDVAFNTAVMLGTVVKFIPEGVEGPDGEEWTSILEAIGIPLAKSPRTRYLQWVRYVATSGDQELGNLVIAVIRASGGVLETDAKDAEESFRGD
jgi:glutaredoxin